MATFAYMGQGTSLSISGHSLDRGIPVELEGHAAEAARQHHEIEEIDAEAKAAPAGSYADLQARARELGIAASGKKAELAEAIAAEESRLAEAAAAMAAFGSDDNAGAATGDPTGDGAA